MQNTLRLTIKKKWFDMIKAGVKKEEYRELKYYWIIRLMENVKDFGRTASFMKGLEVYKQFDYVEFTNGYAANSPRILVECNGIEIREGNSDWGAIAGEEYFVIKLGKIINHAGNN